MNGAQTFVKVGPSLLINVAQVAWIDIDPAGAWVTFYLTAPGPDRKAHVRISDPAGVRKVLSQIGLAG